MATMLPVGPSALLSGDYSQGDLGMVGFSPTAAGLTADGAQREGGTTLDIQQSQESWTRSNSVASEKRSQSFRDALQESQKRQTTGTKSGAQRPSKGSSDPNSTGSKTDTGSASDTTQAALATPPAPPVAALLVAPAPAEPQSASLLDAALTAGANGTPAAAATLTTSQQYADATGAQAANAQQDSLLTALSGSSADSSATPGFDLQAAQQQLQQSGSPSSQSAAGAGAAALPSADTTAAKSTQPQPPAPDLAVQDAQLASQAQQSGADGQSSSGKGGSRQSDQWSSVTITSSMPSHPAPQMAIPAGATNDTLVAASTAAERASVIQQITQASAASQAAHGLSASGGQATVTLNVHPDHWGDLKISLTMDSSSSGTGSAMNATIVAESNGVRDALMSQVKQLHDALQSAGIKVDKIDVVTANSPAAAATMVTSSHAPSDTNFNSQSHSHSQPQAHAGGSLADTSQQGNRSAQHFASSSLADERQSPRPGSQATDSVDNSSPEAMQTAGALATSAGAERRLNLLV